MQNQKDRIIIDTNLWVSFLVTRDLSKFDIIISNQEVTFIFSQELVDEFVEVSQRPKFRKYFPLNDMENLLSKIRKRADFISVTSEVSVCRDSKDNFLLALALDGQATHLITGDKDLLILENFGNTKILTITNYLSGVVDLYN